MKKKIAALLLFVMLIMLTVPSVTAMAVEYPEITAEASVVLENNSGRVLYDKCKDQPMSPASMTKVMTALVILENMKLTDIVKAGPDCVGIEGSVLSLKDGEELTVEDLLYGLMLKSTNDAAIALAEGCSGTVEAFAEVMNNKANEIGAVNTHFVTPNGLTDPQHYTTPYDMALIMKAAIANDKLREIMSTSEYTMPATNLSAERKVVNSNRLLNDEGKLSVNGVMRTYKYEGLVCGKTGYTMDAGSCLVEYAQLGGMDLIAVTMKSTMEGQYPDMIMLLDSIVQNNTILTIKEKGTEIEKVKIKKGGKVMLKTKSTVTDVVENESGQPSVSASDYKCKVKMRENIEAPLKEGDVVADLIVTLNGEQRSSVELCVSKDVKASILSVMSETFRGSILLKIVLAVIIFLLVMLLVGRITLRPSKKKIEERKERDAEYAKRQAEEEKFYELWQGTAPEPVSYDDNDYYDDDDYYSEEEEIKSLSDIMSDWSESEWNADKAAAENKKSKPEKNVKKNVPAQKKAAEKSTVKKKKPSRDVEDNFIFEFSDKNKK